MRCIAFATVQSPGIIASHDPAIAVVSGVGWQGSTKPAPTRRLRSTDTNDIAGIWVDGSTSQDRPARLLFDRQPAGLVGLGQPGRGCATLMVHEGHGHKRPVATGCGSGRTL